MSKAEILSELPKLGPEDRRQILQRLCEDADLVKGVGPTDQERKLLDAAWAEFTQDGDVGTPWRDALDQIRNSRR
jgi:hypothetical protein